MKILIKLIALLIVFSSNHVSSLDITLICDFKENQDVWTEIPQKFTTCELNIDLNVFSVAIEAIGESLQVDGNNVTAFVANGKRVPSFPDGLAIVFPQLKGVQIKNSDLSILSSSDLKNLPEIEYFEISSSQLSVIIKDTFKSTPKLKLVDLSENSISFIDPVVFEVLTDLTFLNLNQILCLFMEDTTKAVTKDTVAPLKTAAYLNCGTITRAQEALNIFIKNRLKSLNELETCKNENGNNENCTDDCEEDLAALKIRFDQELMNLEICKNDTADLNTQIMAKNKIIEELENREISCDTNSTCRFKEVSGYGYSCIANIIIKTEKDQNVNWKGTHMTGNDNDKVMSISIKSQVVELLPINISFTFKYLKSLIIESSGLTKIKSGELATLYSLETLSITGNNITSVESGAFTGLTALKTLNLSTNNIFSLPAKIFESLSVISIIDLSDNNLTYVRYDYIVSTNKISEFYLKNNPIAKFDLTFVWRLQNAQIIDFSGTKCPYTFNKNDTSAKFMNFFDTIVLQC